MLSYTARVEYMRFKSLDKLDRSGRPDLYTRCPDSWYVFFYAVLAVL